MIQLNLTKEIAFFSASRQYFSNLSTLIPLITKTAIKQSSRAELNPNIYLYFDGK